MTLARLLAAALLSCSLYSVAQEPLPSQMIVPSTPPGATLSEPQRVSPDQPVYEPEQSSPDSMRVDRFEAGLDFNLLTPIREAQAESDTTCFAIRSYVMARDNKESDSTHPVRYSTCQPSTQYHVRNAEKSSLKIRR